MTAKLSLADLEAFDPMSRPRGREQRFLCPESADCRAKPRDNAHRSLSVNLDSGAWRCPRCGAHGLILEKQGGGMEAKQSYRPAPLRLGKPTEPPLDNAWKIELKGMTPMTEAALDYLALRGISEELARACDLMSHELWQPAGITYPAALLFPLRRPDGALVATHGRYLVKSGEKKCKTAGSLTRGVFSTPGGLDADPLIITEGPFDALSYAQCGYPAVALVGVAWGDWLPRYCAFRTVYVALDNEASGEAPSQVLGEELRGRGATPLRLRSQLKDANDDLIALGERKMRNMLDGLLKR